ncbi:DNA-processing protein DprA [Desulfoplanes sp.]
MQGTAHAWFWPTVDTHARESEFSAGLALRHTKGIGPRTWKRLVDHFGSPLGAVRNRAHWTRDGVASAGQVRSFGEETWAREAVKERDAVHGSGMVYVLYGEEEYPERLGEICDPPIILYCLGNPCLLKRPCLAVVGSRQCTSYAASMAGKLCRELAAAGLTIVSGFAHGVDRIAHETGSREPGSTIAVLGTGLDIIYPAANKDLWEPILGSGLIVSEFAPGTLPEPRHFPYRNRIISGLSLGVLVVQAAAKSGSLITARLALEHNREVFAVPGPVGKGFEGCHELIQTGAKLVQTGEDVLEELRPLLSGGEQELSSGPSFQTPETSVPPDPALDDHQRRVLDCLREHGKLHIDTLTQLLGWETNAVSHTLVMLEILDRVEQHAGKIYSITE